MDSDFRDAYSALYGTMYGFVFYQLRGRLQAVKLQELAAGKFVTFGHNLDNMLASAYGGKENARKNTALMWTIPFLQTLEESIIDDDQSVSSQDWDELTTILCQIETSNAATYGSSSTTVEIKNKRIKIFFKNFQGGGTIDLVGGLRGILPRT